VTFVSLLELWLVHNPGWTEPLAPQPPDREPKPH